MRSNYYVFLLLFTVWVLALGLFAGPIVSVIGLLHPVIFIGSLLAFAVAVGQFRCPYCGHAIIRPKMIVGTREVTGYSLFPGGRCTNCDQLVDR